MTIRTRFQRPLASAAILATMGFLAVAPPATAQDAPPQPHTSHSANTSTAALADPMYPYGYYATSSGCHNKGLELIESGEVTRYTCFYEKRGPKAGYYHLYTN